MASPTKKEQTKEKKTPVKGGTKKKTQGASKRARHQSFRFTNK